MPPLSDQFETGPLLTLSAKLRCHVIDMKRHRKVQFSDEISSREIERVPEALYGEYWMSKDDFDQIKKDCFVPFASRIKKDTTLELRGLEASTMPAEEFLSIHLERKGALRAVLKEQAFQKQTGYNSDDDIREAYREFTVKSSSRARIIAEKDESAIRQSGRGQNQHVDQKSGAAY